MCGDCLLESKLFDIDFKFLGVILGLFIVGAIAGIAGIFMINSIGWWLILLSGVCVFLCDVIALFNKNKIERMNETLTANRGGKARTWSKHGAAVSLLSDGSFIAAVIGVLTLGFPNPISVVGFCCIFVFSLASIAFNRNPA